MALSNFIKEKKLAVIIALIIIILGSVFYFGFDAKVQNEMKRGSNAPAKQPITDNKNIGNDDPNNSDGVLV